MTVDNGRRAFVRAAAMGGAGLALARAFPAWARPVSRGIVRPLPVVAGEEVLLTIAHQMQEIDGKPFHSIGINGTVPAPLIRLKEGQAARLIVDNRLDEETSLH